MDTKEFLKKLVPDGNICIADHIEIEPGKKVFVHYPFTDHETAAKFAQYLDSQNKTVFYALASFKEQFANPNGKMRIKRTVKNVDRLKAFWLDIDFKTATDVPKQLADFLKVSGLPQPSIIVHSGGGIHTYWTLSRAIPLEDWLPIANGLKALCQKHDLPADHMCTADAARVLRPPGTHNRKYDVPKKVHIIHDNGVVFEPEEFKKLIGVVESPNALPSYMRGVSADSCGEFTGSNHKRGTSVKELVTNCAVMKHNFMTGGKYQDEPEWNSTLLLLKYVDDGHRLLHPISSGHIDYDHDTTEDKWQQKLAADTTGPTLCSTFEGWHPDKCQACPIYKSRKQKTPLSLAYVNPEPPQPVPKLGTDVPMIATTPHLKSVGAAGNDFPNNWRAIPGNEGIETKVYDKGAKEWVWERVLKRSWRLTSALRSAANLTYTYMVEAKQVTGASITIQIPGAMLAGTPETWKLLAESGAPVPSEERPHWCNLMTTWLAKIQQENKQVDTVDRLGWIDSTDPDDVKKLGFSAGSSSYYTSGKDRDGVRVAKEFEQIGLLYQPQGKIEAWQEAADYLTTQNNPAFTTVLASAFAAPLMVFSGFSGAILSLVSTESGIGKTSALKVAQSVWGSPSKGINTTNDTHLSVTRKLAFLNNLPAYWDEVRGKESLTAFSKTAFDVAQGKEKTRLTQSASMQRVLDWRTLMIAASNDSIFDHMAQNGGNSDASIARVFEVSIDGSVLKSDLAAGAMFSALDTNFGRAGQVYAKHLSRNHAAIEERVHNMKATFEKDWNGSGGERFWCAVAAVLVVGASEANKAGICKIDVLALATFLRDNFLKLRKRSGFAMSGTSPRELIGDYTQHFQNGEMIIEAFPARGERGYEATVRKAPKAGLMYVRCGNTYRFRKSDFTKWLSSAKNLQWTSIGKSMTKELNMTLLSCKLGAGTPHELPKNYVIEVFLDTPDDQLEETLNAAN